MDASRPQSARAKVPGADVPLDKFLAPRTRRVPLLSAVARGGGAITTLAPGAFVRAREHAQEPLEPGKEYHVLGIFPDLDGTGIVTVEAAAVE